MGVREAECVPAAAAHKTRQRSATWADLQPADKGTARTREAARQPAGRQGNNTKVGARQHVVPVQAQRHAPRRVCSRSGRGPMVAAAQAVRGRTAPALWCGSMQRRSAPHSGSERIAVCSTGRR